VEGAGIQVQFGPDIGLGQAAGIFDAFIAQRVVLGDADKGRRQPAQIFGAGRGGVDGNRPGILPEICFPAKFGIAPVPDQGIGIGTRRFGQGAVVQHRDVQQLEGRRRAALVAHAQGEPRRQRTASALAETTSTLMGELGMAGGQFEIAFTALDAPRPDPQGGERVEFLIAANPGQPPRPLRKVASGGELSRISLAIEVAALGQEAVPTMIFDEVDSGIGGAVADTVGRTLRALGRECQVLCVTHLPQVAAQGHNHYRVSKAAADGMTRSQVQALSANERMEELARMLGGADVGSEARAAARRLLQDVE